MDEPGKKIYLIGFMGSGKTTLGRKLASELDWTFIDLDNIIEERTGMRIPEIFSSKGEPWFRIAESEALRSLLGEEKVVISTGGGTPCSDDNMKFMAETGLTIYLKMSPDQLYRRLAGSQEERPLLMGHGTDDLPRYIEKKLDEREKWYSMASVTTGGEECTVSQLLTQIKDWIQK